jgi:hypothetical protein
MKVLANISCFLLLAVLGAKAQSPALGAWKATSGTTTSVLLVTPGYFTITVYDGNTFKSTMGGTWEGTTDNAATTTIEFNSADKSKVGTHPDVTVDFTGDQLSTTIGTEKNTWNRIDDGNSPMLGVWQISAREVNGKMNEMKPGARKTIKILTGTRFQWAAINTETGEFHGTGGGTYTFENGAYTEKIEFFSRDSSRVGASLSFKGAVNGDKWDHSGNSSKGDPIHEEWTKK